MHVFNNNKRAMNNYYYYYYLLNKLNSNKLAGYKYIIVLHYKK
jgi:hypothetical protein